MEYLTSSNHESRPSGRRYFLSVLFKKKQLIVAVFLMVSLLVAVTTFSLPPVYEAKSTLLVKFGREYIYNPEIGDQSPALSINQEEVINSEINILTSTDLIEKVIRTMSIEKLYPSLAKAPPSGMTPMEAAVVTFENQLSVQGTKKSNVIEVKFRHENREIAAQAVNLLVHLYTDKHLQLFGKNNSTFFDRQLEEYNKKLLDAQAHLKNYKQANGVSSLQEQRNLLLNQRVELDASHKATVSAIEEARKRLASLQLQIERISGDKELYTHTERDRIIVEAKAQLLTLQLMEQRLLEKYDEQNRQVRDVRQQIQLVGKYLDDQEAEIGSRVRRGNPLYEDAEKEKIRTEVALHALQAKEKVLLRQLYQIDGAIDRLDASENNLQNLVRDVALNERNFQTYVFKREDARIAENMNQLRLANISVIQKATPPAKPVKPKKVVNLLLGVLLGGVTAFGLAFISEYANQGYLMPELAAKDLGLPVLVSIPYKIDNSSPGTTPGIGYEKEGTGCRELEYSG